jgi:hypothetical protein
MAKAKRVSRAPRRTVVKSGPDLVPSRRPRGKPANVSQSAEIDRRDPWRGSRDNGYGIIVTGDSMSPAFESGSTALVNPNLPPRAEDRCIFRSLDNDGALIEICFKELVSFTDDE